MLLSDKIFFIYRKGYIEAFANKIKIVDIDDVYKNGSHFEYSSFNCLTLHTLWIFRFQGRIFFNGVLSFWNNILGDS